MTSAKIIDEIKRLPPKAQAEVIQSVIKLAKENPSLVRYMDEKTFEVAADEVFARYDDLLRRLAS